MHMYGLVVGIAIVVAINIALKVYQKMGGKVEELSRVSYLVILIGIVCARLYHVVDYWEYYQANLVEIVFLWNGGLSIWGGILGGFWALWVLVADRQRLWRMLAAISVSMPLAQAIGRIANGVNHEFGELVYLLPWWSVEMVANLALFGVMNLVLLRACLRRQGRTSKYIVGTYLLGYGVIRGVLEGYREESYFLSYVFVSVAVIIGLWLIKNAHDSSAISKGERT